MDTVKFGKIKERKTWGEAAARIAAELEYAAEVSRTEGGKYDALIDRAASLVCEAMEREGAITFAAVAAAEKALSPMSAACKAVEILCVAHAHIDMNWLWPLDETVDVTLSTFRTMLAFLREYPEFTFSQSQASVYELVEKHDPAMLDEIKKYVREGRWEITASAWVETDKNMVNGEGLSRHILCAKDYLKKLFGLKDDGFLIDFEPDTFGHNANVPEILNHSGVKYYYHCRGHVVPALYRWESPSGKSVLAYCEPYWYNAAFDADGIMRSPALAAQYGLKKLLKVYGVGDHGGGATRRDVERIRDMRAWPIMPSFKFSTYREFFTYADKHAQNLPTVKEELNFAFNGCYTSQSRIKQANRFGERAFRETEKLAAFTDAMGLAKTDKSALQSAWRKHLFNHFHDILPGSGVTATREYAMGRAQERNAVLGVVKTRSLLALAGNLSKRPEGLAAEPLSSAEGAGAGFAAGKGVYAGAAGGGASRAYLLYNNTAAAREFVTEVALWDFDCPAEQLAVRDFEGAALAFEVVDAVPQHYWGHTFRRIDVKCALPPNGYRAIAVSGDGAPKAGRPAFDDPTGDWRQHVEDGYILENALIRAEFDRRTAALLRLTDKRAGNSIVEDGGRPAGYFKYVAEDASKGMTAWVCGHIMKEEPLVSGAKILHREYKKGGLHQRFKYTQKFGASALDVTVSLRDGCDFLDYQVNIDFREFGVPGEATPSLLFAVKAGGGARWLCDVPYGLAERAPADEDRPALSFACAVSERGAAVLSTDSKYGFRYTGGELSVNLIRASSDPDRTPEIGGHEYHICVGAHTFTTAKDLLEKAETYYKPVDAISVAPGAGGNLPPADSLFTHKGGAVLSAVKPAEDGDGLIFRFYEAEGKACKNTLEFSKNVGKVSALCLCDGCENALAPLPVAGGRAEFETPAYSVVTLRVKLEPR
ncbi:MAG: glycosyl hydrolase-related protein [Clostridiales bacterium]|nr:glycosyl hydrolase-related protein [Clostridiales bacterium]